MNNEPLALQDWIRVNGEWYMVRIEYSDGVLDTYLNNVLQDSPMGVSV